MESALTDAIRAALAEVRDPQTGLDVVSAGWVQGLVARDGLVQFALEVPRERARALEPVRAAAERAVAAVSGVLSATCVLTAHRAAPPADAPRAVRPPPGQDRMLLPEIGAIVAVASGKGGVGKSTTPSTSRSRWRLRGCRSDCWTRTSTALPCRRCWARSSGRAAPGSGSSRFPAGG